MFLAGDIGGTKTILALVSVKNGLSAPHVETRFSSRDYARLVDIIQEFLRQNRSLVENSPMAVLAPGTGLGEAYLTWNGHRYCAFSSEGGHADFAPGDHLQLNLLNYLAQKYEHVSIERVCSGIGIPNIYSFLRDEERAEEPDWLSQAIAGSDDPVPLVINNAIDSKSAS